MGRYVVLSKLTPGGRKRLHERDGALAREAALLEGKVLGQWLLLGEFDFMTLIELPDNAAALALGPAHMGPGGVKRQVMPAIDLPLFVRLLGQTTETTGPHRWQIALPARLVRKALRPRVYGRHARRYFKPFTVLGRERLEGLRGPAVFIANHASHLDAPAFVEALPARYRDRVFFGSAADRWFLKGRRELYKQGWWRSLAYGSFPIQRGGGSKSLEYAYWLIERGGSIGIFPEGTRSTTGKLGRFKPGPALIAMRAQIPVVPLYMHGLRALLPKGARQATPGPVTVALGEPIELAPGTPIPAACERLRQAMQALQHEVLAREDARAP